MPAPEPTPVKMGEGIQSLSQKRIWIHAFAEMTSLQKNSSTLEIIRLLLTCG